MKNSNVGKFVLEISDIVEFYGNDTLMLEIGDSNFTNRQVSVNQVVRFLRQKSLKGESRRLQALYLTVRTSLRASRPNSRTDAVDWNEFVNYVNTEANLRSLGQVLKNAA